MTPQATDQLHQLTQQIKRTALIDLLLQDCFPKDHPVSHLIAIRDELLRQHPVENLLVDFGLKPQIQQETNGNGQGGRRGRQPDSFGGVGLVREYVLANPTVKDFKALDVARFYEQKTGEPLSQGKRLRLYNAMKTVRDEIATGKLLPAAPQQIPLTPPPPTHAEYKLPEVPSSSNKHDEIPILMQKYARSKGGTFDARKFKEWTASKGRPTGNAIYMTLNNAEYFENIEPHIYRWIKAIPLYSERKGTPLNGIDRRRPGRKPGQTQRRDIPEHAVMQFASEKGEFKLSELKLWLKEQFGVSASNSTLAGRIGKHEDADELERLGRGHYKLVVQKHATAAHA